MIPLKDENPTRHTAFVTLTIIAVAVGIWFFVQNADFSTAVAGPQTNEDVSDQTEFNYRWAAIPCEVVTQEPLSQGEFEMQDCREGDLGERFFPDKNVLAALFTSMFLHGSLLHLGGNMLYLWIFGNNIEDRWGRIPYIAFYVASGIVATFAHIALNPQSTIPLVGASGAIAGVMGAYFVLFPHAPIRTLIVFIFILFRDVEARWLLGFWFVLQFFTSPNAGVAWAAHVGGFVFGVVVGLLWRLRHPRPKVAASYWS